MLSYELKMPRGLEIYEAELYMESRNDLKASLMFACYVGNLPASTQARLYDFYQEFGEDGSAVVILTEGPMEEVVLPKGVRVWRGERVAQISIKEIGGKPDVKPLSFTMEDE